MADAQWAQSMGGLALATQRLSVLHLSQRWGGGDGTADLLVAGAASHSLAAIFGKSGVRGHGARRRRDIRRGQ